MSIYYEGIIFTENLYIYIFVKCQKKIFLQYIQYVKKLFETNKGNFSGSKPIIGRRITFNPEEIGAFGLEQFFTYCMKYNYMKFKYKTITFFFVKSRGSVGLALYK